jgi:hypothetical protein
LKRFFFLLAVDIVTVYVRKVMSAIITDHRLPGASDLHLKLNREIDHFATFGPVEVPFSSVLS